MRISATDWVDGGWDLEQSVAFSEALKRRECAAIHLSTGGLSTRQAVPALPGYQVPYAARIKQKLRMPTIAVGLITEPRQAEEILVREEADAVALARRMLYDPCWPWHAPAALGATVSAHQLICSGE